MIQSNPIPNKPNYDAVIAFGTGVAMTTGMLWGITSLISVIASEHTEALKKYCTVSSDSTYCFAHKVSESFLNMIPNTIDRIGGVAVVAGIIIAVGVIHNTSKLYDDQNRKINMCLEHIRNSDSDRQKIAKLFNDGKIAIDQTRMTQQDMEFLMSYCKV